MLTRENSFTARKLTAVKMAISTIVSPKPSPVMWPVVGL